MPHVDMLMTHSQRVIILMGTVDNTWWRGLQRRPWTYNTKEQDVLFPHPLHTAEVVVDSGYWCFHQDRPVAHVRDYRMRLNDAECFSHKLSCFDRLTLLLFWYSFHFKMCCLSYLLNYKCKYVLLKYWCCNVFSY